MFLETFGHLDPAMPEVLLSILFHYGIDYLPPLFFFWLWAPVSQVFCDLQQKVQSSTPPSSSVTPLEPEAWESPHPSLSPAPSVTLPQVVSLLSVSPVLPHPHATTLIRAVSSPT